jgi:cyclopropane fatty-acyl-phospholipid synthase-like methyltransferase
MEYDQTYRNTENYFGKEPEPLLKNHLHLLDKSHRILDLGVGQGRHSFFLARQGFQVDALDPSGVAIEKVSARAAQEGLSIRTFQSGFESFVPPTDFYSGILIFGLIQILPWEAIELLLHKIKEWTRVGSLVFIRAFTTSDRSFAHTLQSQEWSTIGRNSFADGHGKFRTYLEPDEILDLLGDYKPIYHWEGLGPEHRHADGPTERHAEVEAIFQR